MDKASVEFLGDFEGAGIKFKMKLNFFKERLKFWNCEARAKEVNYKKESVELINRIKKKTEEQDVDLSELEDRLNWMQQLASFKKLDNMDILQKSIIQ